MERATDRLAGDLHAAFLLASRLADVASAAPADPEAAFAALERAVAGAPIEAGVALLGEGGRVHAWAGSHRLPPRGDGRPVSTVDNPFYLVLEVARDAPNGRRAVGAVVVWASPAVPERVQSVTEDFRARTGVGLRVYPAGTAPGSPRCVRLHRADHGGPAPAVQRRAGASRARRRDRRDAGARHPGRRLAPRPDASSSWP